ncbi:CCA tRNA nucleotidyltransferase [Candidatus Nitrosotenuis sp. DW1]|uniref:CCA tRNA nucleotidyltransferase n=1 Tax=Candidatus Nitrosotenuis sp. DW1 TaxID=2259672 RepID=UPI0015C96B9C|nr:CCA tRNA nucleotidyltransferase [Candidatus Nitrosotenuis sp. DW1]QLH09821.1 CCA tRNA nucleotidyltransferase [Candidatus Nitrosotenuis sp. DW1]
MKILKQVEKIVIPNAKLQEHKKSIVDNVLDLVQKQITKYPQVTGIEVGGSYAKGTWLPEKADIDVFIKFQTSVSEKDFANLGKKIGFDALKNFKPYIRYAEHPFVEAKIKDTKVNLVPCYDVEEGKWKSSADRSTFHTKFMKKSLSESMKNEVRVLKRFLMNNDIYGAEIARQGFSGYVAEVLVLNFGSFLGVLKAISEIKQSQVIGNATKEFDTPIVIMDPIDGKRNLAAAIATDNIGNFVFVSRAFLKNPSIKFFMPRKIQKTLKSVTKNTLVLTFRYRQRSPDIIWGQVKRAANSIATQIGQAGFVVLKKSALVEENTSSAALLFLLQTTKLDESYLRVGPDFFSADFSAKFIIANKKKSIMMWVNDDGKVCSLQKRPQSDALLLVKNLLKKNIEKSGISAGLKEDISRFNLVLGDKITSKSIKEAIAKLVSTDETVFSSS